MSREDRRYKERFVCKKTVWEQSVSVCMCYKSASVTIHKLKNDSTI